MHRDQPFESVSSPSNDQYDFTVDWFSQQSGSWAGLLSWIAPRRILEIGSYEGRSRHNRRRICLLKYNYTLFFVWDYVFIVNRKIARTFARLAWQNQRKEW